MEFVRGACCQCIRREVGQRVLVLVGGVDGAVARQEGESCGGQENEGMARRMMMTAREEEGKRQEEKGVGLRDAQRVVTRCWHCSPSHWCGC